MSIKLRDMGEVGRSDVYSVFPEYILVDEAENGRFSPHGQDEIEALANSIIEYGQQQPVVVRRVENGKLKLVSGYGRWKAAKHINDNLRPNLPVKLQFRIVNCNAEEAFVLNVIENNERAETSPIDDAHNQRRLKQDFGWGDGKIAEFYKRSVSYISQMRKLLQHPGEIRQAVADGKMSVAAAIDLAELPESERPAVVVEATNEETGEVNSAKVRARIRAHRMEKGNESGKARTIKEIRAFFKGRVENGSGGPVSDFSAGLLAFIGGKITDRQMENLLEKFVKE